MHIAVYPKVIKRCSKADIKMLQIATFMIKQVCSMNRTVSKESLT